MGSTRPWRARKRTTANIRRATSDCFFHAALGDAGYLITSRFHSTVLQESTNDR